MHTELLVELQCGTMEGVGGGAVKGKHPGTGKNSNTGEI